MLDRTRLAHALPIAAVAVAAWLAFGRLLAPFDLMVFLRAGHAVLHSQNPYVPATSAAFRAGHAFVYPYVVAWAYAPLAGLPAHVASLVYSALSVAAITGACVLLTARWGHEAALVLAASTTIVGLQMGTLNAVLVLGLAAAWRNRDRPLVCGLLVGLLAVAKLFLAPVAVWLLLTRRYRSALAAGVVGAGALGAGFLAGPIGARGYLHMLSALQAQEATRSWSFTSLLRNVGFGGGGALAVTLAIGALVLACGRLIGRRDAAVFAAAVLTSLLISPIVWSSYLVLLAVPLLATGANEFALIAFSLGSWLLVTPDAASPRRAAIGVAVAVIVAVVAAATRLRERPHVRLDRRWALVGLAVACAGAAIVFVPAAARTPLAVVTASLAVLSVAARRSPRAAPA